MSVGASELLVESEPAIESIEVVAAEVVERSPLQLFWRRFRTDRVALESAGFLAVLVIVSIGSSLIVSIIGLPDPDSNNSNALDVFGSPTGPSGAHPFRVDQLGRDVLSRVNYGSRVSLEVGFIGTAVAALIGTL